MKILCPTDFSKYSTHAAKMAISLAEKLGGELTVLSVFKSVRATGSFGSITEIMRKDAETEMENFIKEISADTDITLHKVVVEGHVGDIISSYADKHKFDVIFIGTQGQSDLENMILGSTTQYVLNHSKTPVFAIPYSKSDALKLDHVLLSLDAKAYNNPLTFALLNNLKFHYNFKLELFHLTKDRADELIDHSTFDFISGGVHNVIVKKGNDPVEEIKEYTKHNPTDAVVMIRREHTWWERIFMNSHTEQGVLTFSMPVLVLPHVK